MVATAVAALVCDGYLCMRSLPLAVSLTCGTRSPYADSSQRVSPCCQHPDSGRSDQTTLRRLRSSLVVFPAQRDMRKLFFGWRVDSLLVLQSHLASNMRRSCERPCWVFSVPVVRCGGERRSGHGDHGAAFEDGTALWAAKATKTMTKDTAVDGRQGNCCSLS